MVNFKEIYRVYIELMCRVGVKEMTVYHIPPEHLYQPPEGK